MLCKGIDEGGLVFYTNYDSRKGRELNANPWASAVLLWHQLQRQVRIDGRGLADIRPLHAEVGVIPLDADEKAQVNATLKRVGAVLATGVTKAQLREALAAQLATQTVTAAAPAPGSPARAK